MVYKYFSVSSMNLLMIHTMDCYGKSEVKQEHIDLGALLQTMVGCRKERLRTVRGLSKKKLI